MNKAFLVTGMHRSATSLVAKALWSEGLDMGTKLIPASKANPKGYFEDADVVALNDHMLAQAGGAWNAPPEQGTVEPVAGMGAVAVGRDELWGFKDPRLCLTLDAWLPLVGDDPHVVAIFRKPTKIAQSLQRRDGTKLDEGISLAVVYQTRLLASLHRFVLGGS